MWSYFSSKNLSYNLRKGPSLSLPSAVLDGTNSVHFKGTLIWNNLPYFVKSSVSLFAFKTNLKTLEVLTANALSAKINIVPWKILLSLGFISYG